MERPEINIVWLKRDLRLSDHAPLKAAIEDGRAVLIFYLAEPQAESSGELDQRHRRFVAESIAEMNEKLVPYNGRVEILAGSADDVFEALRERFQIRTVFSHRETGIGWTFDRDRQMKRVFRSHGIEWREFRFSAIDRGLDDRAGWAQRRDEMVAQPNENPDLAELRTVRLDPSLLSRFRFTPPAPDANFQPGGTSHASALINKFIARRGRGYLRQIAKPIASAESCSRLSPYLAWGNVSVRQVWRLTNQIAGTNRDIDGFRSRLAWRDHFIQRFEMAPEIEFQPFNPHATELDRGRNDEFLAAWCDGRTGVPLIDAAMRSVAVTGWLNFRLRATVVSFLSHLLWLEWRPAAVHLGRMFLDYEPGIHYCQFMMQSAESGFHTIRVYNPVKQSREHDPTGEFIRRWVPELAAVPDEFVHEPWKLGALEAKMVGFELGRDYPAPIVDTDRAYRFATKRLWEWKEQNDVAAVAGELIERHRG